ncbi:MAG: hypothetical protein JWM11_3618 [Planctomycetaceae bacterium]|nr:hypothetical protein [Planctomycetaceae bacterium]
MLSDSSPKDLDFELHAKRSFVVLRSQAELGNESTYLVTKAPGSVGRRPQYLWDVH